jgi:hypothetical protein
MPAEFDVARDDIYGAFDAVWTAGAAAITGGYIPTIYWDGVGMSTDPNPAFSYAMAVIRHSVASQATLAGVDGRRRFRKDGIFMAPIFGPLAVAGGLAMAENLAKMAKSAFEGRSTESGIWFRNVRIMEVGVSGAHYQFNVVAEFTYDEFA